MTERRLMQQRETKIKRRQEENNIIGANGNVNGRGAVAVWGQDNRARKEGKKYGDLSPSFPQYLPLLCVADPTESHSAREPKCSSF